MKTAAWIGKVFTMLAAALFAELIAVIVILGAAGASSVPALFMGAGALAFVVAYVLAISLVYRAVKRKKGFREAAAIVGIVMMAVAAVLYLKPVVPQTEGSDVGHEIRYWKLSTGSTIAYVHVPGQGERKPEPIVFLHGGPGTPDMAGDVRYFGKLAEDGYDVYVYDELGSGRSSRLQNPEGYSVRRDVADLEAIRQEIGAERMILIGHSYGGSLLAHYLVHYGEHVSKAVFSSPGALHPDDHSDADLVNRLSAEEKLKLYGRLLYPRSLLAYLLLQVNPQAAHAFAGDAEMDAQFDRVYALSEKALHAEGKHYPYPVNGLGFYANQFPQSRTAEKPDDIRKPLEAWDGPALILKGSDDYLSWSSAADYRTALEHSRLLYLEHAGHNVYQDQPELVMAAIRAFLSDRPLPTEPYEDENPPPTFRAAIS